MRISDIAAALGVPALGDGSVEIDAAAEPASAGPRDLAVALSPAWAEGLSLGAARAALVWPGADWAALGLAAAIEAPRGRLALSRLTGALDRAPDLGEGLHPTAVVEADAVLGEGVTLGPHAVIGAGARIGPGTRIGPQVTVAPGAVVGAGGLIHAGVRIGRNVRIGDRVILQPNAVIGGDGFSFVTATPSNVEAARASLGTSGTTVPEDPTWHRIASLGGVEIGDDVEIGACSTVDSGTLRPTRIGRGTKIDNLVQVAHNVVVGEDCLLCGNAAIAGSTRIGDRVVLGGKTGIADNLTVGSDVVFGGGSIVLSNVPAGRVMQGYPATRMDLHLESYKALRRLPRLLRDLAGVSKAVPKRDASD